MLISACLLGVACRYDGSGQVLPALDALMTRYELIPICPEQLGGLPTPRTPAERRGSRVVNRLGEDVTGAFSRGAEQACRIACIFHGQIVPDVPVEAHDQRVDYLVTENGIVNCCQEFAASRR